MIGTVVTLLLSWACLAHAGPGSGFTQEQIASITDPKDGAEVLAQRFYAYFNKDRDPSVQAPEWLDKSLDAMAGRVALQDSEDGPLSEARLWQAPASAVYEFFEYTRKTFQYPRRKPETLIEDYADGRARLREALARLRKARLEGSLGGRGKPVLAAFDGILREMDKTLAALRRSDRKRYRAAVSAVGVLMRRAHSALVQAPDR